jgi:hypothetical protein
VNSQTDSLLPAGIAPWRKCHFLACSRSRRAFLFISCLALALRLGLFLISDPWQPSWPQKVLSADSFEYFILGKSLLERGTFSYTWPEAMPNALRLPVYPLFVAISSLGGQLEFLWLTGLSQVILDSLWAGLLFRIVGTLFPRPPLAFGTAFLYAVNPDAVFWSTQIMAETISVWLMVLAVYGLAAAADEKPALSRLCLGGLAAGSVPLVKSAWQYFALGMLFYLLYQLIRAPKFRSRISLGLVCFLLVTPSAFWIGRNWVHWGVPCLSVGGPLQKAWTAKLLYKWSGAAEVPAYTPEMAFHVGFVVDLTKPDWICDKFKNVHQWDPQGLRREIESSKDLFLVALQNHPGVLIRSLAVGIGGALFSPQNRSLKTFLGMPLERDENWRNWETGGTLRSWQSVVGFIRSRIESPATLAWSLFAFTFFGLFYSGVLLGARRYVKKYFFSPWTIYLLMTTPIFFLNGVMAHSRYRLSMLFPLCVIAVLGLAALMVPGRERGKH